MFSLALTFKMLKNQREVQDICIGDCRGLSFLNGGSRDGGDGTEDGSYEDIATHVCLFARVEIGMDWET